MKLFQARTPDKKNESPNSVLLDALLVIFGLFCSLGFHALWKAKSIDARFIYFDIPIVLIAVTMFLCIVIRKRSNKPPLRFLYAFVSFFMGWMGALSVIDFLI